MDHLRRLKSKMPSSPSSSSLPGAKLSKAFKFNKDNKVLAHSESKWGANPFHETPSLEEPSLPRIHLLLHVTSTFFTFLAICMTGAVASFQIQWIAITGGTAFTLFLLIISIIINIILVTVPTVYDRWDKLKSFNHFLAQPRSRLIIHGFASFTMLIAAFIVTISAWTEPGCKNPDNDPHSSLGDDFKNGLHQWCQTKKASGIFNWLSFTAWLVLLVLTLIEWRRDRNDGEPPFVPPDAGISSANVHERLASRRAAGNPEEEDPYAEKAGDPEATLRTGYDSYGYSRTKTDIDDVETAAFGRPSMDFARYDSGMPGSGTMGSMGTISGSTIAPVHSISGPAIIATGDDGRSRTMQLAYNDPYAHIRHSLLEQNAYAPVETQPTEYSSPHDYPTIQPVQAVQSLQSTLPQQPPVPVRPNTVSPAPTYVYTVPSPQQQQRGALPLPPNYGAGGYGNGGY